MIFRKLRKNGSFHMMLLPGIVFALMFAYAPMAGLVIAFQKFIPNRGFFQSKWVGWDNFVYMMNMPDIYQVIYNTVFIALMKIIAGLLVPIIVALLLNELKNKYLARSVQTMIYLPHFLSWVILGGILLDILSIQGGIVNRLIQLFGLDPIFFLGSNQWFPFTLVISEVWKEFGFATIIYLAALTSINPALYEAANIDGASRWKQTMHITLPGMMPIIVLMGVLSLGNVLNAGFEQVFILYSPSVYESGDIIDTMLYRVGFLDAQYGVSTAVGLFKSVISTILITTSYWLAYRFANYRIF
ncbi:ABC transporter permease [Paenibacillus eucommiae]|uniref:Aldouronate transport system permease protein n=1 Tax=Paenibacillus eucommiae TaxID=1355755 RepID=A0ABS4J630_9BACL|nr:ABC transporter permease subunit [Paenibacillus eucommiae]MBP1994259.1 putative aldouronate transport system permease protein [Paenibacillus eucommiae]